MTQDIDHKTMKPYSPLDGPSPAFGGTNEALTDMLVASSARDLTNACHDPARVAGWWTNLATGEPLTIDTPRFVVEKLCLVHSEISEADSGLDAHAFHQLAQAAAALNSYVLQGLGTRAPLMDITQAISRAMEGHRKGLMDDKLPHRTMLEVELADAVIRIFDMAGGFNLDVAGAVAEKLRYNAQRADHKIENRKLAGGKAY